MLLCWGQSGSGALSGAQGFLSPLPSSAAGCVISKVSAHLKRPGEL